MNIASVANRRLVISWRKSAHVRSLTESLFLSDIETLIQHHGNDDIWYVFASFWIFCEPIRLTFGWTGNLRESVPNLFIFILLTVIPQIPAQVLFFLLLFTSPALYVVVSWRIVAVHFLIYWIGILRIQVCFCISFRDFWNWSDKWYKWHETATNYETNQIYLHSSKDLSSCFSKGHNFFW